MENQTGDVIRVEEAEHVAGGDALARIEGLPSFVPGLYTGETRDFRLYEV